MLLLPYHVDATIRRFPLATLMVVLLTVVAGIVQGMFSPEFDVVVYQELFVYHLERPYLDAPQVLFDNLSTAEAEYVRRMEQQLRMADGLPPPEVQQAQQAEQDRLEQRVLAERARFPAWRFGFHAGNPWGMLTYVLLHAGFWHLFSNMALFYVMGMKLEDLWGARVLAVLYVSGGVVAALGHALVTEASIPVIGASGAVAAVMGAFLLRLARVRLRFLFVTLFNLRHPMPFSVPAFVFLPAWFLLEVFTAATNSGGNIATWAHLFGFAYGGIFSVSVRALGLEKNLLLLEQQREETKNIDALARAQDHLSLKRHNQAIAEVWRFLKDNPDDVEGLITLANAQRQAGQDYRATAQRIFKLTFARGEKATAAYVQQHFDLPTSLDSAIRLFRYYDDAYAETLMSDLLTQDPSAPAAPKAALLLVERFPNAQTRAQVQTVYHHTDDLYWQQALEPHLPKTA